MTLQAPLVIAPLVIVNPASASGKTGRRWPSIAPIVKQALPHCEIRLTNTAGEAEQITRQAVREGCSHLVVVGGDGTVHEVVNGLFDERGELLHPDVTLSVLPMGTGSDLCRSLGLPRSPKEAAQYLTVDPTPVDVGWVWFEKQQRGRAFVNIGSLGLSGQVARHFEEHGKGGGLSYLFGIFTASKGYKNQPLELEVTQANGQVLTMRRTVYTCAVANAQYFGGAMHVAPQAYMNDGVFQVVVVGDLGALEVVRRLPALYRGYHLDRPKFEAYDATQLIARTTGDEEVWVELDGEPEGPLPARFELKPSAFKITTCQEAVGISSVSPSSVSPSSVSPSSVSPSSVTPSSVSPSSVTPSSVTPSSVASRGVR